MTYYQPKSVQGLSFLLTVCQLSTRFVNRIIEMVPIYSIYTNYVYFLQSVDNILSCSCNRSCQRRTVNYIPVLFIELLEIVPILLFWFRVFVVPAFDLKPIQFSFSFIISAAISLLKPRISIWLRSMNCEFDNTFLFMADKICITLWQLKTRKLCINQNEKWV